MSRFATLVCVLILVYLTALTDAKYQSDYTKELRTQFNHDTASPPKTNCPEFKKACENKCKNEGASGVVACYPLTKRVDSSCWCWGTGKGNLKSPKTGEQLKKVYWQIVKETEDKFRKQRTGDNRKTGRRRTNNARNKPRQKSKHQTSSGTRKEEGSQRNDPNTPQKPTSKDRDQDPGQTKLQGDPDITGQALPTLNVTAAVQSKLKDSDNENTFNYYCMQCHGAWGSMPGMPRNNIKQWNCTCTNYALWCGAVEPLSQAEFREEALAYHNYYRALHDDTEPLVYDEKLERFAQNYLQSLPENAPFQHNPVLQEKNYGENAFYLQNKKKFSEPFSNMKKPVEEWYSEAYKPGYDFNNPRKGVSGTLHLTQGVPMKEEGL